MSTDDVLRPERDSVAGFRAGLNGRGTVVWITGQPSSGKSTLAERLLVALRERGRMACLLDGDAVRAALVPAHSYDEKGRASFYATLAQLAALLADQGLITIVAATAHRRSFRDHARRAAPAYLEVFVDVEPAELERRDPKGLYAAVRDGRLNDVPGADLAYEVPMHPDVVAAGGEDACALAELIRILG